MGEEIGERLDQAQERLRETTAPPPAYLTVAEVAELARCEHKAVRNAIAAGKLVAFQPAQKWLIREQDARAWIESRPARARASEPRRRPRRPTSGSVATLREIERKATGR